MIEFELKVNKCSNTYTYVSYNCSFWKKMTLFQSVDCVVFDEFMVVQWSLLRFCARGKNHANGSDQACKMTTCQVLSITRKAQQLKDFHSIVTLRFQTSLQRNRTLQRVNYWYHQKKLHVSQVHIIQA